MTGMCSALIPADWPAPDNIKAYTISRIGGVSVGPYQSLNPAAHVGDVVEHVSDNRQRMFEQLGLPSQPVWLDQVHGVELVCADDVDRIDIESTEAAPVADGSFSTKENVVCVVQTADCLPVLICDKAGKQVAAVHAGWRGLVAGILDNSIAAMNGPASDLLVWLGPAISAKYFEVGPEVRRQFIACFTEAESAFTPSINKGHFMADLYALARINLRSLGVTAIYGGDYCSYEDAERFFSYRRNGVTGRMATLIYRQS